MSKPAQITFFAFFIVAAIGFYQIASADDDGALKRGNLQKRVIARSDDEVDKALAVGCRIVRRAGDTIKALRCPDFAEASISLPEDIQLFAMKENEGDNPSGLAKPGGGAGAIVFTSPLIQIGANIVNDGGNAGVNRKVVILDTGYNYTHPELISSYLGGWDFVNNDNDPADDNGHGSHVAGIITADGPNVHGVAPGVGVVAGKVLDSNGSGYFTDVIAGIYWAVNGPDGIYGTADDFGADAISISLGSSAPYLYKGTCDSVYPEMTAAIKYATEKGIVVAIAAGNSGKQGVSLPGCISYATTVAAVDNKDAVASFSGRGTAVDIAAPGVNIYSTILNGNYASWSGTSMATPMISAVVALMKFAHPTYAYSQVTSKLFSTAKDLGVSGKDTSYGAGRVRANLAVQ